MIRYAAFVPHSPVLLTNKTHDIRLAWKHIADQLQKLQIRQLICLSPHPRYHRVGVSVLLNNQDYHISFKEFGDLLTTKSLPVWWSLYHNLRQNSNYIVEPLQDEYLDYGHSIPLFNLTKYNYQPDGVLCLNTDEQSSSEDCQRVADMIKTIISEQSLSCAIICSGDIQDQAIDFSKQPDLFTLNHDSSCSQKPLVILKSLLADFPHTYNQIHFFSRAIYGIALWRISFPNRDLCWLK